MDKGGQVDTFILDIEKSFDTPHEPLKCKLFGYGIGGKTLKTIDSLTVIDSNVWWSMELNQIGPLFCQVSPGNRS